MVTRKALAIETEEREPDAVPEASECDVQQFLKEEEKNSMYPLHKEEDTVGFSRYVSYYTYNM